MRFHFDVRVTSLAGVNWPMVLREISRPVIDAFQATCPMNVCGYGTEIVEPFYLESIDPNTNTVNVSVSIIGSFVYTPPELQQAALVTFAGLMVSEIHRATGRVPDVTYQSFDSATRWEDSGDPLVTSVQDAASRLADFFSSMGQWKWIAAGAVLLVLVKDR